MGIPEDIARLEIDLRELIIKYEQYFFGIEKREPLRMLDAVERAVRRYQNVNIPNTSQRFKYDSLVSTLSVHKQKWVRTNRLIEEGKYQRDRFRMSLHQKEKAVEPAPRSDQPPPPRRRTSSWRRSTDSTSTRVSPATSRSTTSPARSWPRRSTGKSPHSWTSTAARTSISSSSSRGANPP